MKKSDKPTEYILMPAESTCEWDECDFMIVHITPAWQKAIEERLQLLKLFNKDNSFCALIYSDVVEGFYTYPETNALIETGRQKWCFIETTPDEIANLPEVNNELTACELCFNNTGLAWYKACTAENFSEFLTETFNIRHMLELLQNTAK